MGIVSKKVVQSSKKYKKNKIILDEIRNNSSDFLIPTYIFLDRRLTPLEALVKHLRENLKLSYNIISKLLSRNVRDIYKTYAHAFDKSIPYVKIEFDHSYFVPVSIFSNRKISALEAIVVYLKEKLEMSYCKISVVLDWTQSSRCKDLYTRLSIVMGIGW